MQLNAWFSEIDITNRNRIGGKEAVFFLRRTSVPNDILSSIWVMISKGSPSVDLPQFYRIMRLVSLAASPVFSGAPPSLELYSSTKTIFVPLPAITAPVATPIRSDSNNIPSNVNNGQSNVNNGQSPVLINNINNSPTSSPLYSSNPNSSPTNQYNTNVNVQPHIKSVESINHNVQPIITNNINNSLNNSSGNNSYNSPVDQTINQVNTSSLTITTSTNNNNNNNNNEIDDVDDDEFSEFSSVADSSLHVVPTINNLNLLKLSMNNDDSNNNLMSFDNMEEKNIPNIVEEDEEDFDDFVDSSVMKSNLSSEFNIINDNIIDQSSNLNKISSINNVDLSSSSSLAINVIKPNDDSDLLLGPVLEEIPTPIVEAPTYGDMSAFDELIETDLKVQTEEWDDFEEGREEIKQEEIELKTDDLLLKEEVMINFSDDLFQSNPMEISAKNQDDNVNDDDIITNTTVIETEITPTNEMPDTVDINNEDEFVDFGDFEGVEIETKIDEVVINNDNLFSNNDNEDVDDFGDFGDFEGVEIDTTKNNNINNNLEVEDGVDDFGDFEDTQATAATAVVVDDDELGDFGDFGDASLSAIDNDINKDKIDFLPDIDVKLNPIPSSIVAPHEVVTHTSSSVNDLLDFLDDSPPINTNNSTSNTDLLSMFPSNFTENKPLGVDIEEDFKVCFDNNEVITTFESNNSNGSKDDDFGDFEGVEIENNNENINDDNNNNNFGNFGDFENTIIEDNSKSIDNTKLNQSPVKLKTFSLSELELMSLFLSENHLYEDSYACIQHVNLLKKISEYSEEKKNALENDDLELAIKLKNEINIFSKQLASIEEENIWSNLSKKLLFIIYIFVII
jgi:hypothetical protein